MTSFCKDPCFFGNEGHCGKTKREYYTHCESLLAMGVSQRGYPFSTTDRFIDRFRIEGTTWGRKPKKSETKLTWPKPEGDRG